jgi:hypothetical protein
MATRFAKVSKFCWDHISSFLDKMRECFAKLFQAGILPAASFRFRPTAETLAVRLGPRGQVTNQPPQLIVWHLRHAWHTTKKPRLLVRDGVFGLLQPR